METSLKPTSVRSEDAIGAGGWRARLDRASSSRWVIGASVAAVYSLVAVLLFWHVWAEHPTSDMQVGGDQWRNVWFLAWTPYAIAHGHNPLFSSFANAPVGVNILSAGGIPLLGLLFAPVTEIWGPVASYNVASTAALALSALAAYALLRRFTAWRPAAFAGGLLYGFAPPVIAQAQGHLNLSFVPLPPLIFLLLHELIVRRQWKPRATGLLLGVLLAAQFLIAPEILLDTVIVGAIAVVVAAIVMRRRAGNDVRWVVRGLAWAGGCSVVLLAYPVWFMLAGPAHVTGKLNLVPQAYRADLIGPLLPDSYQMLTIHGRLLRGADHFATARAENGSYLGITLLAFLLLCLVLLRRHAIVLVAGITGICAFILSLGATLAVYRSPSLGPRGSAGSGFPLPGFVLEHLPVVASAEPVRYSLLVALCAAVVFAYGLTQLRGRLTAHRFGGPITMLAAGVCLLPLVPAAPFVDITYNGTPPYFLSSAVESVPAGSTAVLFPFPSSAAFPPPSIWQAEAHFRFRMVGGSFLVPQGPDHKLAFSGILGYTTDSLTGRTFTEVAGGAIPTETASLRSSMLAEMHAWNVRTVIAVWAYVPQPQAADQFLTWLLGPNSTTAAGAEVWKV
ncbi:MAG: hypothetical protein JO337_03095 [Acidimicrobiales bacterium]|nr:hypothetical protein [Acidimicrobiales bacterium]